MTDRRALKILFDTYWSPQGWKGAGRLDWSPSTPADDLDYAIEAGVMFPPRVMRHDATVERLAALRERLDPATVGRAFVASLSSQRVEWRSALGSFAVARHLPRHRFRAGLLGHRTRRCPLCGALDDRRPRDLSLLSFERLKWGGVRHAEPGYMLFDLERLLEEGPPEPGATDRELLARILAAAARMPAAGKLGQLVEEITPLVPGNRDQRRTLISMLGYAAVLAPEGHPGFLDSFVPFSERAETPWYKDDWPYPVSWWRGGAGVNDAAVELWFGSI